MIEKKEILLKDFRKCLKKQNYTVKAKQNCIKLYILKKQDKEREKKNETNTIQLTKAEFYNVYDNVITTNLSVEGLN